MADPNGGIASRTVDWLTDPSHWSGADGVPARLAEHAALTGICLLLTCLIALPVAVWLGHIGRGGVLAVNISNIGRAVPTFAVLVLLFLGPLGETGTRLPTIVALVLFAVPPVLTNAYVGMREVDADVRESARGMGMTGWQLLRTVELPLAAPLLMTGVRTAAVQLVATATLAALPGGGGLGRIITAGFGLQDTAQVVAGALLVAVFALLVELLCGALQRRVDPARRSARTKRRAAAAGSAGSAGGPTDSADSTPVSASAAAPAVSATDGTPR